jgi:DNA-binding LacI/PurR family transcriptional regulator
MRVTLKDLAASLGLSVMAVSKALRDAPDISAATKARVKAEAARRGYVANTMARSLRGAKSGLFGLIVPSLNDPLGANLAAGLLSEVEQREGQLLVASSMNHADLEWSRFLGMVERRVEAVFLLPVVRLQHRLPVLDGARQHGVPLVFFDRFPANVTQYSGVGWVVSDNARAAELATQHLIDLGHSRILYLSAPLASSSASEHFSGFKRTLQRARIPFSDQLVFQAGFDIESGKQAIMRALAEEIEFTAMVCGSDAIALGAMDVLQRQGFRVPRDVSVVGMGDGSLAAYASPALTTVRQSQVEMGRAAFHVFQQMRSQEGGPSGKTLPVELIQRDSTDHVIHRLPSPARTAGGE